MKKLLIKFFFIIFLFGCSNSSEHQLAIVIEDAYSSKIDIKDQTYTVYFLSREPLSVRFELTNDEKNEISKAKELLQKNWKIMDTTIESSCIEFPKFYTKISIQTNSKTYTVRIDDSCDEFESTTSDFVIRVKKFIKKINGIIKSKQEIKNAPKSDMIYL